jgi:hypothetical protein
MKTPSEPVVIEQVTSVMLFRSRPVAALLRMSWPLRETSCAVSAPPSSKTMTDVGSGNWNPALFSAAFTVNVPAVPQSAMTNDHYFVACEHQGPSGQK